MGLFGRKDELASLPTLRDIPAKERRILREAGEEVSFSGGETVVRAGDREEDVFLILAGRVGVLRGEARVATLGPGDLFGEASFLTLEPRSATIVVDESLRALRFRFSSIDELLERTPEFATTMHGLMLLRAHENRSRDDDASR